MKPLADASPSRSLSTRRRPLPRPLPAARRLKALACHVGLLISAVVSTPLWAASGAGGANGAKAVKAPASRAPSTGVSAVVQRVQARYDGARDFTATFDQMLTQAATKRASRSAGKVTFKKPGKMRWDYTSPEPRMVLADGVRLWLWEPEDQQAFRQELASSQLPAALAFLTGQGRLTDEFVVTPLSGSGYGAAGDEVLGLAPKKPSAQVQRLIFVVEATTGFVRETVVFDAQGNTNDLVFRDIHVNTGVADAFFSWTPPPGTRVIDPAAARK